MANFTKYSLKLIKEKGARYDVENKITCPSDAVKIIDAMFDLSDQAEEVMVLMALNTKNQVIGNFEVARGAVDKAIIHPRELFKRALLCNATSIMIAHNHPSGNTTPSQADIQLTNRLYECGELLGIKVLDHLIIGDGFTSLKEKGYL